MALHPTHRNWRPDLLPLRVRWPRAAGEGMAGCALIILLLALFDPARRTTGLSTLLSFLADVSLIVWPAWRMRTIGGRLIPRLFGSVLRAVAAGLALGLAGTILDTLFWPPLALTAQGQSIVWFVNVFQILFLYLWARAAVVVGVSVRRRVRRRLRWQLTWSHLAVIVLTFAGISAIGSGAVLTLLLHAAQPNATKMTASVAALLHPDPAAPAIDRAWAQGVFDKIENGSIAVPGAPPLSAVNVGAFAPVRVLATDRQGHILAMAQNSDVATHLNLARADPLPAAVWQRLGVAALRGRATSMTTTISLHSDNKSNKNNTFSTQTILGAAPVMDRRGHVLGVAIVQIPVYTSIFKTSWLITIAFIAFVFASGGLILLTSLPTLGIAILFGFFLARGLTRRLEAVSRVTTAIAAGDLTQRAPVNAENEIGRLAEDINRMAMSLGMAMNEMQQARLQAEGALRARQELVASISHELRTPLAIVRAHLDTLAAHSAAPVSAGAGVAAVAEITVPEATLHALQSETERLSSLVDDLFTLSRAETGVIQVRREPVDVAALVGEIATLMRPLAQSEGMISLMAESPPGLPCALADPDRLRQIVSNLVRNAVRHTPDGGIIVLSVSAEGGWVVVSVADTGEGIAPEHLPHIFERFYRVDQSRTRELGGAGLGLAIVREFVELMDGRVSVQSTPGEGSCFRVYLPMV